MRWFFLILVVSALGGWLARGPAAYSLSWSEDGGCFGKAYRVEVDWDGWSGQARIRDPWGEKELQQDLSVEEASLLWEQIASIPRPIPAAPRYTCCVWVLRVRSESLTFQQVFAETDGVKVPTLVKDLFLRWEPGAPGLLDHP